MGATEELINKRTLPPLGCCVYFLAWRRPEGDTDASSKALNSPIKTKTKEEERADLERVQQEMEAKLAALPLEEKWADESIDDLCLGLPKSSFDPSKENKLSTTDLQPTFRDHCDRKPETPLSVQQPLGPVGEPQPDKPLDKTKPKEGMPPPKTQGQAVRSFDSRMRRPSRAEGEKTIVVKICLCLNSEDTPEIIPVRLPKRVELD